MANLPFMLGAAAGVGIVYLLKKRPKKNLGNSSSTANNDGQESNSKASDKNSNKH